MENKENKKNILIVLLILAAIILSITLILTIKDNKNSENVASDENQKQIELLSSQLQEYQSDNNNDNIEKENVCINFLKTYYSVQHSTSKAASLPQCKPYLTEQLYNKLFPAADGKEYEQGDVDVDYTSSISIKDTYSNNSDSDKLIVRCTIKRTVNKQQSINEYFVSFNMENVNKEWLIRNFELISVQGG